MIYVDQMDRDTKQGTKAARLAAERQAAELQRFKPLAWAVIILGVVGSLAANLASADPTPIGYGVALVGPVTMTASFAVLEFVPSGDKDRAEVLRLSVVVAVGLVAAWLSYWHIVEVALAAGESSISAHLIPFGIDGMILAGTLTLARIQKAGHQFTTTTTQDSRRQDRAPSKSADAGRGRGGADAPAVVGLTPSAGGGGHPVARQPVALDAPPAGAAAAAKPSLGKAEREAAIAAYLVEHPDATRPAVAKAFGISDRTVSRTAAWENHRASQSGVTAAQPLQLVDGGDR